MGKERAGQLSYLSKTALQQLEFLKRKGRKAYRFFCPVDEGKTSSKRGFFLNAPQTFENDVPWGTYEHLLLAHF